VNSTPDRDGSSTANAALELVHLQEQAEVVRAVLRRLQEDVIDADTRLGKSQTVQLIEANEQLVVATLRAQTEAATAERALIKFSREAELDELTKLPNRQILLRRFTHATVHAKQHGTRLALLFVDLNNFKWINDTLGHAAGDQVLKLAAHCLTSSVPAADTVSRYGGDEFLILLNEVSHADATLVASKVIAALGGPIRVGGGALCLTASIGISVYPDDGEDVLTLIDLADAAMYRAKKHGPCSIAFHGKDPIGERKLESPALTSAHQPATSYELALAEHERRHEQLREANEQLVLAALGTQELLAAAEQAKQRQTEFLAVVAHELRNPLAPIRAAAAILGRIGGEEPLLTRVRAMIERQVEHMSRLVSDLLDLSRINTGKLRVERQRVEMHDVIESAIETCLPAMETRLQHFNFRMPPAGLAVDGDPTRLAQIFCNLLDNASKYTPDGGNIGLESAIIGNAIVITVSDTGIGITPQALPNVFEPFVQDSHAIGFNGVGLGIGLTVVRELVEAHGGAVVASSAGSGLGSQFVITLPLVSSS
jgi:diguanylate cyclase (GGDEF)-like protein